MGVNVIFKATGDGSSGALAEPREANLHAGGRNFGSPLLELNTNERGDDDKKGRLEGSLGFRLDRRGAAKTGGEYLLEYGEAADNYQPPLKLRMGQKPTGFQSQVAEFLGGYLAKEREETFGPEGIKGQTKTE